MFYKKQKKHRHSGRKSPKITGILRKKHDRTESRSPKDKIVLKTCMRLVSHFRNLHENKGLGFHTRLFSHMLHPEREFVFAGRSVNVNQDTDTHPEHIVPCAVLISECRRMISQGATDEQIAPLLAKHWKIATITVAEKNYLDFELGYKSKMPDGWTFEEGDTFARLHAAKIVLGNPAHPTP